MDGPRYGSRDASSYGSGHGRALRGCCALAVGALLLTGCSDDPAGSAGSGAPTSAGRTTGAAPSPSSPAPSAATPTAPPTLDFTPDPARAPRTKADAERLALAVLAGPESWGPDYVKREPYLSPDGHWPVLPANCRWESGPLPATVLHSVTGSSELPGSGGKGTVRVSATVTVHRSVDAADWEMAETLEEALRCPAQTLREGERITGLMSLGNPFGVGMNYTTADALNERGKYVNDAVGGEYLYGWSQSRVGQVTVAVSVKGARGYTDDEITLAQVQALTTMITRAEKALEVQS
ncbi:hypothetical protein [Streptomyces sp. NPDC003327]